MHETDSYKGGLVGMKIGLDGGYQELFGGGIGREDVVDAASVVKLWLLRNMWSIVEQV